MLKVAIVFTIGCSVLVCNAVLSILPLISGLNLQLPDGCLYVEGILSVLSCTLFLVGSTFAFVEAWTLDESPGLGSRMQGISNVQTTEDDFETKNEPKFHGSSSDSSSHVVDFEKAGAKKEGFDGNTTDSSKADKSAQTSQSRYLELTIFASTIFLASSALYLATSIASLVTIIRSGEIARWIRYPQLVAASGFAIASSLLLIKTQRFSHGQWWRLPVYSAAFNVNFWNLVGSLGFIACAYFGLLQHAAWAQQQFGYSYLWGSWAFLLGSIVSWYRSLHRQGRDVDTREGEKSPV